MLEIIRKRRNLPISSPRPINSAPIRLLYRALLRICNDYDNYPLLKSNYFSNGYYIPTVSFVDKVRKEFRSDKEDLQRGFKEYIDLKEIYSKISQRVPWYNKVTQQFIQEKHKPDNLVSLTSTIKPGNILISHPLMRSYFNQCVILIIEHSTEGSEGVILDCVRNEEANGVLWFGGPVSCVRILHTNPALEGKPVMNNLFCTNNNSLFTSLDDVRLFTSISTWGSGQLEQEINIGSWFLAESSTELLFNVHKTDTGEVKIYLKNDKERVHMSRVLWRRVLQSLGGEYAAFSYLCDDSL